MLSRLLIVVVLTASLGCNVLRAAGPSLLSDYGAEQVGLQVLWTGALAMRVSDGRPAMLRYHIMEEQQEKLFDLVVDGKRVMTMSPLQMGRDGRPLGEEGVNKYLEFEKKKLLRRGKTGEIVPVEIPIARLYALGQDGTLASMDAETGRVLWSVHVGNPGIIPLGFDVNDKYVSVISGANLHLYNTSEGKDLGVEFIEGAPIFGPLLGRDHTIIWSPLGAIEGYRTEDILAEPYRERVIGGIESFPVRSPNGSRMAWPTDRGHLYVLETMNAPSVPFRLEPSNPIASSVSMAPGDQVIGVSKNGTAYCIAANNGGKVRWRTIVGSSILKSPTTINNLVLMTAPDGQLIALKLEDGSFAWKNNPVGISEVIGGDGKDAIYALTTSKSLVSISSESGAILGSIALTGELRALRQNISDRVFLFGPSGQCQCLAPRGKTRLTPIYRIADAKLSGTPAAKPAATPEATPPAEAANPFGVDGAMAPAPSADDVFGGGAAAPAGGAAPSMPDPFGAPP